MPTEISTETKKEMKALGKKTFHMGGVHPEANKIAHNQCVEEFPLPDQAVVYMTQHLGAPSKPIVAVGDHVLMGQKIAEAGGFVSVPISASVSGTVKEIKPTLTVSGSIVDAIYIENDEQYTPVDGLGAIRDYTKLSKQEIRDIVKDYIDGFIFYHCFETPNIRWLNERIEPFGQTVCFMAEYYLPDLKLLKERECEFELKILNKEDFKDLYKPEWANALCMDRKELDVLGIGAYDGSELIGFAGCSADAKEMWHIGVDVLPTYRRRGVASALTSRLALEILERDKVPFYCSAWSNIRSARNAVKSGFLPAWAEMTVKDIKKVDEING